MSMINFIVAEHEKVLKPQGLNFYVMNLDFLLKSALKNKVLYGVPSLIIILYIM